MALVKTYLVEESPKSQEDHHDKFFLNHRIFRAAYLDTSFFNIFDLYESWCLNFLKEFLFKKPKPSYPGLTRLFYVNLDFKDNALVTEVGRTKIYLTIQDFRRIY